MRVKLLFFMIVFMQALFAYNVDSVICTQNLNAMAYKRLVATDFFDFFAKQQRDYDREYLVQFVNDTAFFSKTDNLYILRTKAFNAIRLSWENHQARGYFDALYLVFYHLGIMRADNLSYSTLITLSLQKARQTLLYLSRDIPDYHDDSALYLGIALSYYLQDGLKYGDVRNQILHFLYEWEKFGSNVPKNLMKMTDYASSLCVINFFKNLVSS